jgi:hypothetical protein
LRVSAGAQWVSVDVLYVTRLCLSLSDNLLQFVACHQLGEFYQAVERNSSKAKDIFRTNCEELNFQQSCFSLGIIHLTNKGKL